MRHSHDHSAVEIVVVDTDNAHVLENVDDDVFDHPVRREFYLPFLADPGNVLIVAVCNGEVIGMVSGIFYVHPDKPVQLFVNEVGVAERYQRVGIGKDLLRCLLEHAESQGCAEAWVATEEDNAAARALYKAMSGKENAERAVVYTWQFVGKHGDA